MNIFIDDENFEYRLKQINDGFFGEKYNIIFFVDKDTDYEKIKILRDNEISIVPAFNSPYFIKNDKFDIVYFFKTDDGKIYRRDKLEKFLSENYNSQKLNPFNFENDTYNDYDITKLIEKNKPLIIINEYNKTFINQILKIEKENLINLNIVYDVYDLPINKELLDISKIVFCSSKVQLDEIEHKNKFYIPNGCTVKEYKQNKKHDIKTAVYCGRNINKIDFNLLNLLKALNEDWNIEVIGVPEEKIEKIKSENPELIIKGWMEEDELHEELCKCHLGLCLLQTNDVTKGQLSDKFFNYVNAHIPTLINEELAENYNEYKDFISVFDFDKLELNKYLKEIPNQKYEDLLKECDWNNRFQQMMNIIKKQGMLK